MELFPCSPSQFVCCWCPKINEPTKKWATEVNRTFSKKEIQMAKKHEKMLTTSSHKRNAN
jgi:hypothetical protein